ncbi:MAG: molybdenum cofactor guanylyltransferase [Gemmatimonadaceae bacterium]|nr:molybdenum cofactor guanylyltransferase [Gloeobacterales cyanobacterium ES-bin-141]
MTMFTTPLTAIILAGGQSRRMGQDKALLLIAGIPLIRHVADRALQVCTQLLVVTSTPECYRVWLPEAVWVEDLEVGQGPLMGLYSGMRASQTVWNLALGCDTPTLDTHWLRGCAEELCQSSVQVHISHSEQGFEPLTAFYHRDVLRAMETYLAGGQRSFQHFIPTVPHKLLAQPDLPLQNCNTPEQYTRLRQQLEDPNQS